MLQIRWSIISWGIELKVAWTSVLTQIHSYIIDVGSIFYIILWCPICVRWMYDHHDLPGQKRTITWESQRNLVVTPGVRGLLENRISYLLFPSHKIIHPSITARVSSLSCSRSRHYFNPYDCKESQMSSSSQQFL